MRHCSYSYTLLYEYVVGSFRTTPVHSMLLPATTLVGGCHSTLLISSRVCFAWSSHLPCRLVSLNVWLHLPGYPIVSFSFISSLFPLVSSSLLSFNVLSSFLARVFFLHNSTFQLLDRLCRGHLWCRPFSLMVLAFIFYRA